MNKIKKVIDNILDLVIKVYFNFYYFDFRIAIKLPLLVSHNIYIDNMGKRGCISIENIERYRIKLGTISLFLLGKENEFCWNSQCTLNSSCGLNSKNYGEGNILIGGVNKVLKTNIGWSI